MLVAIGAPEVRAEDRADLTTTWYLERRRGELGGLSVVHPQIDLEVDAGDTVDLGLAYSADVVRRQLLDTGPRPSPGPHGEGARLGTRRQPGSPAARGEQYPERSFRAC